MTDEEHKWWYQELIYNRNAVVFSAFTEEHIGDYVGNVWLWNIDWRSRNAEVRILIGEENCRGRGYGVDMIRQITRYAFQNLNLNKVYAYVIGGNTAASRAFRAAGFSCEGHMIKHWYINGEYVDVDIWAKINIQGER